MNYDTLIAKRDLYCYKYNASKSKKGKALWYGKLMDIEEKLLPYGGNRG